MNKKGSELIFISQIASNGSRTIPVSKKDVDHLDDTKFGLLKPKKNDIQDKD